MKKNIFLIILSTTLFHTSSNQAIPSTYTKYQYASIKTLGGLYCLGLTTMISWLLGGYIMDGNVTVRPKEAMLLTALGSGFAGTSLHSAIVLLKSAHKDFAQKEPITTEIEEISIKQ